MFVNKIVFPAFTGCRCLMMPYIQGDFSSLPDGYDPYEDIVNNVFIEKGKLGFLTIDESEAVAGVPHRGTRAKHKRALHVEAGRYCKHNVWGNVWGGKPNVVLDDDVEILLANNVDNSCAIWNDQYFGFTEDGDIGHLSEMYPYSDATFMASGEVHKIGIFTPHESMPIKETINRQFLRIMSSGIYGKEDYFTDNPKVSGRLLNEVNMAY